MIEVDSQQGPGTRAYKSPVRSTVEYCVECRPTCLEFILEAIEIYKLEKI